VFLRRCQRRKNDKQHTYWALVESYRTAQGSRQRVVAYLGELKPTEQDGWAKLGAHLDGETRTRSPQLSLFDPPRQASTSAVEEEPVKVRLQGVTLQRLRDFGDVWLAWGLWRMLELDQLLEGAIEPGREEIAWGTVAANHEIGQLRQLTDGPRVRARGNALADFQHGALFKASDDAIEL